MKKKSKAKKKSIVETLKQTVMNKRDFIKLVNGNEYKLGVKVGSKVDLEFDLLMKYFEALGKKYNPDFFIDEMDIPVFEKLFYYFTQNKIWCSTNNININKGIMLVGGNGVGKSTILRLFTEFFGMGKLKYYSMSELGEKVSRDGLSTLDAINFSRAFVIDDVGSEKESMYFGIRTEVFNSILMKFEHKNFPAYKPDEEGLISLISNADKETTRLNPSKPARIYASTNLCLDEFEERYGKRVYSRMAGFFNILNFPTRTDKRALLANVV
nr:hypothetical protein [Nonlabens ulvanivorans]